MRKRNWKLQSNKINQFNIGGKFVLSLQAQKDTGFQNEYVMDIKLMINIDLCLKG